MHIGDRYMYNWILRILEASPCGVALCDFPRYRRRIYRIINFYFAIVITRCPRKLHRNLESRSARNMTTAMVGSGAAV